jgi:hypothetical protein
LIMHSWYFHFDLFFFFKFFPLIHTTNKRCSISETILSTAYFTNLPCFMILLQCNAIKLLIPEEHLPWLSRYIVLKRVRHEYNFHDLYSRVLNCLNNKRLNSMVLSDTIKKIKVNNEQCWTENFFFF